MKAPSMGSLALVIVAAVVGALAVRHAVVALSFPYPIEYPEGITVHWTQQAAAGASLYPAVDPVLPLHNPYPPLFYRVAALLQNHFANPFLSARLTALAGLFLCSGVVAWMLRRNGRREPIMGASAGLRGAADSAFSVGPTALGPRSATGSPRRPDAGSARTEISIRAMGIT